MRQRFFIFIMVLLLASIIWSVGWAKPAVCLYENPELGGEAQCYEVGGTSYVGKLNDRVSSVKISSGNYVMLFEDSDFRGRACTLTRGSRWIEKDCPNFNDKVSSLIAAAGMPRHQAQPACPYMANNYGGDPVCVYGSQFTNRFKEAIKSKDLLMKLFSSGSFVNTSWWQQANALETLIAYYKLIPSDKPDIAAIIQAVYDRNKDGRRFINEYFDDSGWWALAWISAFEITGDRRYLETAKVIFDYMAEQGWDERTCGGGMFWRTAKDYKNAITSELFLRIALRLHLVSVKEPEYRGSYWRWAVKAYRWFNESRMINAKYQINDGLGPNCANNHGNPWTYNQGVILGVLADLYRITGDSSYLTVAMRIVMANMEYNAKDGVLFEQGCIPGGCGDDNWQFKGIFIRNLAALLHVVPKSFPYRTNLLNFIGMNARTLYDNRSREGYFGSDWHQKYTGGAAVNTQSAGLDALVAALGLPDDTIYIPEACLYEDADFGGSSYCVLAPQKLSILPNGMNDKISSIRIFPGASITVYWDANFQGRSQSIPQSTPWLGQTWDNAISSIEVMRQPR